jgi:hypothetical protein
MLSIVGIVKLGDYYGLGMWLGLEEKKFIRSLVRKPLGNCPLGRPRRRM